ncbi:MAG: hypothetical protein GF400_06865 [Candidatus Eisenbacteria bacterium]|nr:hypothetical protein [Candidatus Eisenbacteria bacterium]
MKGAAVRCVVGGLLVAAFATSAGAAVGCTLNDPDRDIRRIFPGATNYRTDFIAIADRADDGLYARVERRLGDELDDVYEAPDVPYAYYTVLQDEEVIGRVHGVNQKGTYGGMQLILATDPDGVVVDFYYQRIASPEADEFTDEAFTSQFVGLTLLDFQREAENAPGVPRVESSIDDPSDESREDFEATLRGLRKNLILLDEFMLGNSYYREIRNERRDEGSGNAHEKRDTGRTGG